MPKHNVIQEQFAGLVWRDYDQKSQAENGDSKIAQIWRVEPSMQALLDYPPEATIMGDDIPECFEILRQRHPLPSEFITADGIFTMIAGNPDCDSQFYVMAIPGVYASDIRNLEDAALEEVKRTVKEAGPFAVIGYASRGLLFNQFPAKDGFYVSRDETAAVVSYNERKAKRYLSSSRGVDLRTVIGPVMCSHLSSFAWTMERAIRDVPGFSINGWAMNSMSGVVLAIDWYLKSHQLLFGAHKYRRYVDYELMMLRYLQAPEKTEAKWSEYPRLLAWFGAEARCSLGRRIVARARERRKRLTSIVKSGRYPTAKELEYLPLVMTLYPEKPDCKRFDGLPTVKGVNP